MGALFLPMTSFAWSIPRLEMIPNRVRPLAPRAMPSTRPLSTRMPSFEHCALHAATHQQGERFTDFEIDCHSPRHRTYDNSQARLQKTRVKNTTSRNLRRPSLRLRSRKHPTDTKAPASAPYDTATISYSKFHPDTAKNRRLSRLALTVTQD